MDNHFFVIKTWPNGNKWSFHNDFQKVKTATFSANKLKEDFAKCQPGDEAIGFDTKPFSSAFCICKIIGKDEKKKIITADFSQILENPVSERMMAQDPLLSQTKFVKSILANSGQGITLFGLEKNEFDRIIELSKNKEKIEGQNDFSWVPFYMELADKFAEDAYKNDVFVSKLQSAFEKTGVPLQGHIITEKLCDPFTAIAQFNHGANAKKRIAVCQGLKKVFNMKSEVPTGFDGIPTAWYQRFNYAWGVNMDEKKANQILWSFLLAILEVVKNPNDQTKANFAEKYDQVHAIKALTHQMPTSFCFWVRPNDFISLESKTSKLIENDQKLLSETGIKSLDSPDGKTYLEICSSLKKALGNGQYSFKTFPELSSYAYNQSKNHPSAMDQQNESVPSLVPVPEILPYSEDNFIKEVFMAKEDYEELKNLLLQRKNIILTGAPGVGKTFAAKRLAYSILGQMDESKVQFVQFHQNYSYEDFVLGYKPSSQGTFKLQEGVFYSFCKKAKKDTDSKFFFIIDEINRGNMAKIFGELLMMIECDYRGKPVNLVYSDETHAGPFSVPENVYLIGMMNTADRSIAMIDYALRRRFSFYPMKSAFDSQGFKDYLARVNNSKLNQLIGVIKELNSAIDNDDSLGEGYEIGHSYFIKNFGEEEARKADYSDEWLRGIVNYDLIPTLHEYWFDNMSTFNDWSTKLRNAIQ